MGSILLWLNDCLDEFKPVHYKRYVDDIFVLFRSPHHLENFLNCLSKTRAISKFSKITRVIYPQNCPNQTCCYWLITQNQQTVCIETNIF